MPIPFEARFLYWLEGSSRIGANLEAIAGSLEVFFGFNCSQDLPIILLDYSANKGNRFDGNCPWVGGSRWDVLRISKKNTKQKSVFWMLL